MFEIKKITYYETKDGKSFKTYKEAEEHNMLLMGKEIPFNEIRIFNRDGKRIFTDSAFDYDKVWFIYADTDNGTRFLERFVNGQSLGEDIKIEPKILYRYDDEEGRWVNQEEDLERLNSCWANLITFEEARC